MSQSDIIRTWQGKSVRYVLENYFKLANSKVTRLLKENNLSGSELALSGDSLMLLMERLERRKR